MAELSRHQAMSITDLADRLGMDRSTASRLLNPLEKQGLLETRMGPDSRAHILAITALGNEKMLEAMVAWRRVELSLQRASGPQAWSTFQNALHAVDHAARHLLDEDDALAG